MKLTFVYFKRVFSSPVFYVSILCIAALVWWGMCAFAYTSIISSIFIWKQFGFINYFYFMLEVGTYRKLIMLFASLPFAAEFSREFRQNCSKYIISRSSISSYLITHGVMCFFITFLTAFVGMMLCTGIIGTFAPVGDISDITLFTDIDKTGWLYITYKCFHFAVSLGAWSVSGTALSAIFPDTFVAVCTPLIMSYILEFVSVRVDFLPNLHDLCRSHADISDNPFIRSAYIVFVFAMLALGFGIIFFFAAKRRLRE